MMINDKLCQLLADVVTSRPSTTEAARDVYEHFVAIGQEWSASTEIPDSVRIALLRPEMLSLAELDRAATRLHQYVREMPTLQSRLAPLSMLLTLLGGVESRQRAGQYYIAALFPPAIASLDFQPQAASAVENQEASFSGLGGLVILRGEDDKIDERVITACSLAWKAYDAVWSAEIALLDMAQDDTHFKFACDNADALGCEWRGLFGCVCEMWALTPPGRYAKARLAEYLTHTEPVGPVQDEGLRRLFDSMSRDLDRAKRQGWVMSQ
jgi:hypothetical protein